jgi:hypothetical protein
MTIQELIDKHIRFKLADDEDERWGDDVLVNVIVEVIDLLDGVVQKLNLQFAKKRTTLTTVPSQTYIDVSSLDPPLASIIGLYRASTKKKMRHEGEEGWEAVYSTSECVHYMYLEDRINLKGTPSKEESLYLWYWPDLDTSAYAVGTDLPWGGRLDQIIAQHVVVRCQNVDEMDIGMDNRFLQFLEKTVQKKFSGLYPGKIRTRGWNLGPITRR